MRHQKAGMVSRVGIEQSKAAKMVKPTSPRAARSKCSSTIARRAARGIPVLFLALATCTCTLHLFAAIPLTRLRGANKDESRRFDSLLPIDGKTGKLVLPPHVSTVVIDVGAMNSDYLHALNRTRDNSTAIVLFEPLPANQAKLNETIQAGKLQNQVFLIQAALGETEHEAQFNVATGPSCGSLLGEGPSNFWCTKTKEVMPVQVFTLGDFMQLMPQSDGLRYHLKVDAEGADLLVVKGARESVRRFDTIVVECQDVPSEDDPRLHRKGAAYYAQVKEYLCDSHSFCGTSFDQIGMEDMQGNAMFWKTTPGHQQIRLTPVLSASAMKNRYIQLATS